MVKFFLIFLLWFGLLFSQEEKWSSQSVKVGDVVVYELNHPDFPSEFIDIPQIGTHPSGSELPFMEILSIQEKEGKLEIKVRFLEPGEHGMPISWKTKDGENKQSELKINILSNLTGSEFDVDDISEPIEFNGPFLLRLFAWILFLSLFLGGLSYFILKWKRRSSVIKDANYEPVIRVESVSKNLNQLEKLLEQEEILHKEFVFLLSESVKERFGMKLKKDLMSYTNKELLDLIQEKCKINSLEKMKLENYLDMIKYMPNEEVITKIQARKVYENWMETIGA